MNVIDYIKWRGDISFEEKELNVVDSLLFSALSYEILDEVFLSYTSLTIAELADIYFSMYSEEELKNMKILAFQSYEILKAMKNSIRYKNLVVSNYVNEVTYYAQFSALCFSHEDKWKYVAYRGTDDHFIGWKEDFAMFYEHTILGVHKAQAYLEKIAKTLFGDTKLYVGGHSKGGHFAMYAAGHMSRNIQDKIVRVDNFDGPGFHASIWEEDSMQNIISKVHTYAPADSFFGRWLNSKGEYKIIQSKGKGLRQHSIYNWEIDVTNFVYVDTYSENGNKAYTKFMEIIYAHNDEQLEEMITLLFDAFLNVQIYTLKDLTNGPNIKKAFKEIVGLDPEIRKLFMDLIFLNLGSAIF